MLQYRDAFPPICVFFLIKKSIWKKIVHAEIAKLKRAKWLKTKIKKILRYKIWEWSSISLFCQNVKVPNTHFTTTNSSPQHQAAWGQHCYRRYSSTPIYSKPPSLHPPRKFPFPSNLLLRHICTPIEDSKYITVHIIDLPIKWTYHPMPFLMLFTNIK